MSWLVVALKVLGAVVALLTVTSRWPTISANLRTWAGIVAAPVVLAVVLLAVTAALGALGLLPTT